jgi:hypothetical protein
MGSGYSKREAVLHLRPLPQVSQGEARRPNEIGASSLPGRLGDDPDGGIRQRRAHAGEHAVVQRKMEEGNVRAGQEQRGMRGRLHAPAAPGSGPVARGSAVAADPARDAGAVPPLPARVPA